MLYSPVSSRRVSSVGIPPAKQWRPRRRRPPRHSIRGSIDIRTSMRVTFCDRTSRGARPRGHTSDPPPIHPAGSASIMASSRAAPSERNTTDPGRWSSSAMDSQVNSSPYRSAPRLCCSALRLIISLTVVPPQFEWAWNTPYRSRHLLVETTAIHKGEPSGIRPDPEGAICGKTASKSSKKALFPRSIGNRVDIKLKVLRKMMTTLPWSQYPLKLLFFEESAYRLWLDQAKPPKPPTSKHSPATACREEISASPIEVAFRPEGVDGMRKERHGIPSSPEDQCKAIEVYDGKPSLHTQPVRCQTHFFFKNKTNLASTFGLVTQMKQCWKITRK